MVIRPVEKRGGPRLVLKDITDQRDKADRRDRNEPAEPTEQKERNEPTDPMDRADPIEPTERTEPFEQIDSTDPSDQSDHFDREPDHPGPEPAVPDTRCARSLRAGTFCLSHCPHHGRLAQLAGATRVPDRVADVPPFTTTVGTIGWSAPFCLDAAEITIFIPIAPKRSEPGGHQNATQCLGLVSAYLEEQCAAGAQ